MFIDWIFIKYELELEYHAKTDAADWFVKTEFVKNKEMR